MLAHRDRRSMLTILILSAGLLIGCAKQDEQPEATTPSGTSHPETPGTPDTENSTSPNVAPKPAGSSAQPLPSSLELSYITDDFTGAIIIHPSRFLSWDLLKRAEESQITSYELSKLLPRDIDFDPAEFGIELRNIEQIVVLLDQRTASLAPAVLPPPLGDNELEFGPPAPKPAAVEPLERPLTGEPDPSLIEEPDADDSEAEEAEQWEVPFPTVIIRFRDENSARRVLESDKVAGIESSVLNGVPVKRVQEAGLDAVFHLADAKTLIVTRTRLLEKMLEQQSVDSPLVARLKQIDPAHDLILVVDLSPFREILQLAGGLLQGTLPPNLAALGSAPAKTQLLTLTGGVHADSLLSVSVTMENPDDVTPVNEVLSNLLTQGRQWYQLRRAAFAGVSPTVQSPQRKVLLDLADELVSRSGLTEEENRLTFTIPKSQKLGELVESLSPAMERIGKAADYQRRWHHLRDIGYAFLNYESQTGAFPGAGSDSSGEHRGLSWRVHLLPLLDHAPLYEHFHFDEPWDSEHNKTLIQYMPDIYKSPGVDEPGMTSMHMLVGEGAFSEVGGTEGTQIKDGPSQTILVVEAGPEKAAIWTKPGGLKPSESLGTLTDDFILAVFADGFVRQIPASIDAKSWKAFTTIASGDAVTVPPDDSKHEDVLEEAYRKRLFSVLTQPHSFHRLASLTKLLFESREESQRAVDRYLSKNHLKQIGLAFHNYHDSYRAFPGAGSDASGEKKGLSWRVHLLPFLGQNPLYQKFNLDEPWDSEHNKPLIDQMPDVFRTAGVDDPAKTSLHVFVGEDAFFLEKGRRIRDYTDGTSNSLLVVEAAPDRAEVWTKPGGLTLNEDDPLASMGHYSKDSFLALFADGAVRTLSTKIDRDILKALITISGGEIVRDY